MNIVAHLKVGRHVALLSDDQTDQNIIMPVVHFRIEADFNTIPYFMYRRISEMNNLNSILVEGNLTHDPDMKVTQTGASVCNFSVATNRYYRNKEKEVIQETLFLSVESWGNLAETCGVYLAKGKKVRVVGRLKQSRWKNEEGEEKEKYIVVAEHVDFSASKE